MSNLIKDVENSYRKHQVVDVQSGDTVRVHQKIKEGNKERVQIFEGLVIKTSRTKSLTSAITVRRIASGVGVEKSFLLHSPLVVKVEVVKRANVRRNYLSYMRNRSGKSARLASVTFDKNAVNTIEEQRDAEIEAVEQTDETHSEDQPEIKAEESKEEPKQEKAVEETSEKENEHTASNDKTEDGVDEKSTEDSK